MPWWLVLILVLIPLCCFCCLCLFLCCRRDRRAQKNLTNTIVGVNVEMSEEHRAPPPPPQVKELTLQRRIMLATSGSSPRVRLRENEDSSEPATISVQQHSLESETMAFSREGSKHEEVLGSKILEASGADDEHKV